MEETKTTMHVTFDMIIAGSLIVIAAAALLLGRQLWSVFSSQEAANQKMKDYVNYAAFDGTEVSGQDVLNLLISLEDEDPNTFVAIRTQNKYMANPSGGTTYCGGGWYYFMPSASSAAVANNLEWVKRLNGAAVTVEAETLSYLNSRYGISNLNNVTAQNVIVNSLYASQFQGSSSYTTKVDLFTNPQRYGGYKEHTYDTVWMPGYSKFFSMLVFDADSSTDPIGYIFIQEAN